MFDVAVIGGGPAGCAAAITLARAGRSVVLLERVQGAPEGFCGEFLSPDGVGSLDLLGVLDDVLVADPAVVFRWSVHGSSSTLRGSLPGPALGVSRRLLDPTLRAAAKRAGVDVREGIRVRRVEPGEGDSLAIVASECSVHAHHVVGAAGRSAHIPGISPQAPTGPREYVAFKAHFRGPVRGDLIRLYPLGGVYVGVGPIEEDTVNVCYLARRRDFEAAGAIPDALLDRAGASHPAWAECWAALDRTSERWLSTGGLFFHSRTMATVGRVTLCGDAAGLVSPFLGEGMSMALEAGCMAGNLVHQHFDRPGRLSREYTRAWRSRFGARMRWGERLQRLLLSERADSILRWLVLTPALPRGVARRCRSASLVHRGTRALRDHHSRRDQCA